MLSLVLSVLGNFSPQPESNVFNDMDLNEAPQAYSSENKDTELWKARIEQLMKEDEEMLYLSPYRQVPI